MKEIARNAAGDALVPPRMQLPPEGGVGSGGQQGSG